MPDESRDPELEWARTCWDAPPPSAEFHDRVLNAYVRETGGVPRWPNLLRMRVPRPVAAAAAMGALVLAGLWISYLRTPQHSASFPRAAAKSYRPVFQPRFIVISRGEHP